MKARRSLKIILVVFLAFCFIQDSLAQKKDFNKLFKKKMTEANYYYQYDNFHLAYPILIELYNLDSLSIEVNYKLAVSIYYIKRDKSDAIKPFEVAKKDYIDAYYYLGRLYHLGMKFDKSISRFHHYKNWIGAKTFSNTEVDYYMKQANVAQQLLASPVNADVVNMGENVNSAYPDYAPIISSDEASLLFTSRRKGSTGGLIDPYDEFYEDIYIAYKDDVGDGWTKPSRLRSPINTETHDAGVALSNDGSKLYLYRTSNDLATGDIYTSEKSGGLWMNPQILKGAINTRKGIESSIALSPDGNVMYFSSTRPGGYGGRDLYKVMKLPNGEWSLAQNLGSVVNTSYDEDAPFIHPDGQTLFFSSKGHKNMGGYDIYRTELTEDDKWEQPENMGYPVNTVREDIYFVMTEDREKAYFSSNREGGIGHSDLYEMDMPDNISNYMLIKSTVRSVEDSILKATITVIDTQTKNIKGIYRTNENNGRFVMILKPGRQFKFIVEAEGYRNWVSQFRLSYDTERLLKDIRLEKQ